MHLRRVAEFLLNTGRRRRLKKLTKAGSRIGEAP
jgi:hypothetical protein